MRFHPCCTCQRELPPLARPLTSLALDPADAPRFPALLATSPAVPVVIVATAAPTPPTKPTTGPDTRRPTVAPTAAAPAMTFEDGLDVSGVGVGV